MVTRFQVETGLVVIQVFCQIAGGSNKYSEIHTNLAAGILCGFLINGFGRSLKRNCCSKILVAKMHLNKALGQCLQC